MEFLKQSSGQSVQEILQATIVALCQNSVLYESRLRIDAIIGITVDDSEILLVNIKENLEKTFENKQNQVDEYCEKDETECSYNENLEIFNTSLSYNSSVKLERLNPAQRLNEICVKNEMLEDYSQAVDTNGDLYVSDYLSAPQTNSFTSTIKCTKNYRSSGRVGRTTKYANLEPFHCKLCKKSFSNKSGFLYHKRQHTLDINRLEPKSSTIDLDVPVCNFEGDGQESKPTLTESKHCSIKKIYTCNICGTRIRHHSSFKRHKDQHNGIVFRCLICEKVYNRRDSLLKHQRTCSLMKFNASEIFQ